MHVFSRLIPRAPSLQKYRPLTLQRIQQISTGLRRDGGGGGDRTFSITPSRYAWNQYKDKFHFYFMLGAIPAVILVFITNVFIGPAKLAPIPEGYVPKQYEYHKHPITRFFLRHCFTSHQQDYERNMFYVHQDDEIRQMRLLADRVEELMAARGDYPNYYVRPTVLGKYFRFNVEEVERLYDVRGNEFTDTSIPKE